MNPNLPADPVLQDSSDYIWNQFDRPLSRGPLRDGQPLARGPGPALRPIAGWTGRSHLAAGDGTRFHRPHSHPPEGATWR